MRVIYFSSALIFLLAACHGGNEEVSADSCATRVSSGDRSVGISAVKDAVCASGGLGCFPRGDQCRFCRVSDSSPGVHLKLCAEIQASAGSEGAALDCSSFVSVGDRGVGISAVAATNPTCSRNGLGCFLTGQCRLCQTRSISQSNSYFKCSDIGQTFPPTSGPTNAPTPTVASTSTVCSSVVVKSGLEGISYISESRCKVASPTLLGCSARTSCRLCRDYKNEANQYLVSCRVLQRMRATHSARADPASFGTNLTESVAADEAGATTKPDKLSVTTQSVGTSHVSVAIAIGAVVAIAAVLVVIMVSAMYAKSRRNLFDECKTRVDAFLCGKLSTPPTGRGCTPREGSLVLVVSQSSFATI